MAEGEQRAAQPPTRLRPARPPEVILAAGTHVNGELKTEGDVRIDGVFGGHIEAIGWVIVGERARVQADIVARHVQVHGRVHGAIRAIGQVQVGPTGRVWGDIAAAGMLVDPGGEVYPAGAPPPSETEPPQPVPAAESATPPVPAAESATPPVPAAESATPPVPAAESATPPVPAAESATPPVEVIRPAHSPAREHLRQAEARLRRARMVAEIGSWLRQRWVIAAGAVAAGLVVVCGVLALAGNRPGPAGAPAAALSGTATSIPSRPAQPATALPPAATRPPTATPSPIQPTPTPTPRPTVTPTQTPTRTPTKTPTRAPTRTAAPPTRAVASPTSTVSPYPFAPDGPVTTEYPNCAPAVVWLRGQVRNAAPEQLAHVQVRVRHPDGRVLTEPVQPNGSYEIRLYSQGPCPVTLVDSRDGTPLSPTVNIEYADTCNGSAFVLHWKRVGP